jgi:hypothetical protein
MSSPVAYTIVQPVRTRPLVAQGPAELFLTAPSAPGPSRLPDTLTGSGTSLETAERRCDSWQIEAAGLGLDRYGAYRQAGTEWITAERTARRPVW